MDQRKDERHISSKNAFNWFTGHRLAVLSNGALKFARVTLGDAGLYQCLAKNEAGVAVGRTKLVLQGSVLLLSEIERHMLFPLVFVT